MRLKVLHVVSNVDPESGGPTRVLTDLAKHQTEAGHSITICTTDRTNTGSGIEPAALVPLRHSGAQLECFRADVPTILYSRSMHTWLKRSIENFDIVHVHGLYRFPTTYAAALARKRAVPYIIRPHGSLDPYLYRRSTKNHLVLKRIYERLFDLPNLHGASAIHYTTEEERQRVEFLKLRSSSFVLPNGIDWSRFERLPHRGAFRKQLGVGDAPLVLFLGRLHFKKGLDLLIPAFARVRQAIPSAVLVIAGPDHDGYARKVREWVARHQLTAAVSLVGPLIGADTVSAYVDSDLFVLPSYTENFGVSVVEAMACGVPVVISDQVNIHRETVAAHAGVVTRCDIADIATAVTSLLGNPSQRRQMGAAGRLTAQRNFTWEPLIAGLTVTYEGIVAKRSSTLPITA